MITSKNNAQLKKVKKLIESPRERRETGCFVAEGFRLVREVPVELLSDIYVSESASDAVRGELKTSITEAETVADDVFRTLSDTITPQGILAVVRKPVWTWDELLASSQFILLDEVRDPGNLGTIVRTAEAAGAAVVMSPGCADIFNPKVIRSTMGSIFRVPHIICRMSEAISMLHQTGVRVYAAALDSSTSYKDIDPKIRRAFIVGNEANGISEEVSDMADERIFIPMKGQVESLNAAVSAAVLMFS